MFDQQRVGSSPSLCPKARHLEVVLSAPPARLLMDDTQAYIRMNCKGGNPVSAPGVGGNGPWKNLNCSPHLEVALRNKTNLMENQAISRHICVDHFIQLLKYLSNHNHFITTGFKHFSQTNSADPRQRVPLRTGVSRPGLEPTLC